MKRTFICLLSIFMIIATLPPFTTSAVSGTPISTADEFLAMQSGGEYYLTADITLPRTYSKPFEGTLNGNGKTLTISAPIFEDFSGKVENLTIEGKVVKTDEDAAAFALNSSKGFEATNCTNNAKVTVMGYAKYAAGFVGTALNTTVKFTNCINNGAVYLDSTADEQQRAGGFGGIIDGLFMDGCVNNGNIYVKGSRAVAGGLVARVAQNKGENNLYIYNSENNGNVTVEDTYIAPDGTPGTGASDAGGIVGHIGIKDNVALYQIWGCRNNGNIDALYRVGGLVGYCYASGYDAYIDIQFCINTGDVTYGRTKAKDGASYYDFASGLVAYTNSAGTTIKYSIDTGKVTLRDGAITHNTDMIFIGASSADITQYDLAGVYILNIDIDPSTYIPQMPPASSTIYHEPVFADKLYKTTLEDLASGKVAYEINLAAKKDTYGDSAYKSGFAFYQKIGDDALPSVDSSRGWVVLSGDTYANGERAVETTQPEATKSCQGDIPHETTQAHALTASPETTSSPETEPPVQTGCGGFSCYAILIVIVCTSCLWKKWTVVSGQWTERCE